MFAYVGGIQNLKDVKDLENLKDLKKSPEKNVSLRVFSEPLARTQMPPLASRAPAHR